MPNADLSEGHFKDDSGEADDSVIPEFVDRFSKPMPILYLRCRRGVPVPPGAPTAAVNSVITDGTGTRAGPYDISQIIQLANANNPITTTSNSATRAWTDFNGDFIPQGDPLNPLPNEELTGPLTNAIGARAVWGISAGLMALGAVVGLVLIRGVNAEMRPGDVVPARH